jgi:hypothetical protein
MICGLEREAAATRDLDRRHDLHASTGLLTQSTSKVMAQLAHMHMHLILSFIR